MARIRTIKPEFFTSEDIVSLSPWARLFYIALWCEADRDGRLVWRPGTYKLRYFPADKVNVEALSRELTDQGLVVLYGDGYAFIPAFPRHQYVNPREAKSDLPEPPDEARAVTRAHASARVSDAHVGRKEGRERKGKEVVASGAEAPPAAGAVNGSAVALIPLNDGTEYAITPAHVAEFEKLYPAVDISQTLNEIRGWNLANPARRKTRAGVLRHVTQWLAKEQNRG